MRQTNITCPPRDALKTSLYWYSCPKCIFWILIIRKKTNSNWGTLYKMNGLHYSKLSMSWKTKPKKCFRLQGNKEIRQINECVILDWEGDWHTEHRVDSWRSLSTVLGWSHKYNINVKLPDFNNYTVVT